MRQFIRSSATWIAVSAIAVFWFAVWAIGADIVRNTLDLATTAVALYLCIKFLPPAWHAFRMGGQKDNWRLLMSNSLFWLSICAASIWAYAVRWNGFPDWMLASPIPGFFRLMTLGSGILAMSATADGIGRIPQDRIYYIALSGIIGMIVGVLATRFVMGAS